MSRADYTHGTASQRACGGVPVDGFDRRHAPGRRRHCYSPTVLRLLLPVLVLTMSAAPALAQRVLVLPVGGDVDASMATTLGRAVETAVRDALPGAEVMTSASLETSIEVSRLQDCALDEAVGACISEIADAANAEVVVRPHLGRLGDEYIFTVTMTGGVSARLLAQELGLPRERWRVSFQSRLGRARWLQPYTEAVLRELGERGTRRLDVICPGFVADCLETLEEIAIEGRETYEGAGGHGFRYIGCLNDSPAFAHRGRVRAGADGTYAFSTILPGRYLNGPQFRPRHVHVRVDAPGHVLLTTQLYFEGDPFLDADAFVKPSLVRPLEGDASGWRCTFDIVLAKA